MPVQKEIINLPLPSPVIKYLDKYGYDKWKAEWNPVPSICYIVVVPSVKEFNNLPNLLLSLAENDKDYFNHTLILFVVNNSESADEEIKTDNSLTLKMLRSLIKKETNNNEILNKVIGSGLNIGVVDVSSPGLGLPGKEAGVGFARKIGMDIALTLFDYSSSGKKIIGCLDADCTVDKNYLTTIVNSYNRENISAAVVDFEHDFSDESDSSLAIICYEIFLRYYVLGAFYAGSPYAYHSVGSCMSCDYESYIKIEGMNKRKAAEDFYFLEKLAKLLIKPSSTYPMLYKTGIYPVYSTINHPSSRGSWRVPFGTGQRVNRFITGVQDEYGLYDPLCFEILKKWLNLFGLSGNSGADFYLVEAKSIHNELYNFLIQQKFAENWEMIVKNSKTTNQLNKQKVIWFDGFRTMKLLHHLRDYALPDINMFDALDRLFVLLKEEPLRNNGNGKPGPDMQKKYLIYLRDIERKLFT